MPGETNRHEKGGLGVKWIAGLSILFMVPRLVRMAYPRIWFEDPVYLYTPWLILHGKVPYHDFSAPYITFLEEIFAGLFAIFGASSRLFEVVTALLVFGATWFLFLAGRSLAGMRAGIVSAVLFSWNYLLFRYHVQQREIYTTFFELAAYALVMRFNRRVTWQLALGVGAMLGLGAIFKQSIAVHAVPIGLFWFFVARERIKAVACAAAFASVFWSIQGWYYLRFGEKFLLNTMYFHFVKGATESPRLAGHLSEAGVWMLLGLLGATIALVRTRDPRWLIIPADIACNVAFNLSSLTFWPHYLISILGTSLLGSAYALGLWWDVACGKVVPQVASYRPGYLAVVPLLFALWLVPPFRLPLPFPGNFGFGGESRGELARAAAFIRNRVPEDGLITAPPFLDLEAGRQELITFKDNLGNMILLERLLHENRLEDARRMFREHTFREVRGITTEEWMPAALERIRRREVDVVVPDFEFYPDELFLIEAGYEPCHEALGLTFWCPKVRS